MEILMISSAVFFMIAILIIARMLYLLAERVSENYNSAERNAHIVKVRVACLEDTVKNNKILASNIQEDCDSMHTAVCDCIDNNSEKVDLILSELKLEVEPNSGKYNIRTSVKESN